MADFYDTLTAAQQDAFRSKLLSNIAQGDCPTEDLSGITTPDSLKDAGNREGAVACFRQANFRRTGVQLGTSTALDAGTYTAIMSASTMPMWEKLLLWGGGAFVVLTMLRKGRKGRRRR